MPKHFSKSTKKGWRQFQTQGIKEAIGTIRDEERIQQGIKSAENAELFVIDKKVEHEKREKEKKEKNRKALKAPYEPKKDFIMPIVKEPTFQPRNERKKGKPIEKEVKKVVNEPTKERELDIWATEVIPKKEKKKQSKLLKMPHPGQSYNPRIEDHQEAILNAHKTELDILKKADQFRHVLNLPKNHKHGGGSDILDGIKAQNQILPEEKSEEPLIEKKQRKKKKITKIKKRNINKSRAQYKKHLLRQKGNTNIDEIVKELDKFDKITAKRKQKREELKNQLRNQLRLKSTDILLSEELPNGMRALEPTGNIWTDTLKSLKNADLFDKATVNKLKNQYEDGIPIKDKN